MIGSSVSRPADSSAPSSPVTDRAEPEGWRGAIAEFAGQAYGRGSRGLGEGPRLPPPKGLGCSGPGGDLNENIVPYAPECRAVQPCNVVLFRGLVRELIWA